MQKFLLYAVIASGVVLYATGSFALLPVQAIELPPPNIKPVAAMELAPPSLTPVAAHELTPVAAIELVSPSNEPETPVQSKPYALAKAETSAAKPALTESSANLVTESPQPIQEIPKRQTAAPSDYNPAVY